MPVLSRYLHENCKFSLDYTGWVFFFLGLGTVLGTLCSGWFIDRVGSYKVIITSLFCSSFLLILLSLAQNIYEVCFLILIFSFTSDLLRPAIFSILKSYTNKENQTQSFSLMRIASNLGLVIAPLIVTLIIFSKVVNYKYIFVIDAISCMLAGLIILFFIKEQKNLYNYSKDFKINTFRFNFAPLKDSIFLLNAMVACICGVLFFQFFSVFPIYFNSILDGNLKVDYLFSFLAIFISLLELFVVNFYLRGKFFNTFVIGLGLLFFASGYSALYFLENSIGISIYLVCVAMGAIHTFPFSLNIVNKRSHNNNEGVFMAMFQMSYGFSQMISGKLNLQIVNNFGFQSNWILNIALACIAMVLTYVMYIKVKAEKRAVNVQLNSYF